MLEQQTTHHFVVHPNLPHDVYIGADLLIQLNAQVHTIHNVIWAAQIKQEKPSDINLHNLRSGQLIPEACVMINEHGIVLPAYSKGIAVRLVMKPGQMLQASMAGADQHTTWSATHTHETVQDSNSFL
ncbi:uncharacterized protein V6R79_012276 [Siganus canaliculatus]